MWQHVPVVPSSRDLHMTPMFSCLTILILAPNAIAADGPPSDTLATMVALIAALAWPTTVLILVFFYRQSLARILSIFEHRVAQGDTVSAFGVSVSRGAPLPAATTPPAHDARAAAIFAAKLNLRTGSTMLLALGELSKGDDESAVVGTGDALALAVVQARLLRVSDISVTSLVIRQGSTGFKELLDRYANVVSIGGPEANRLTGIIMGANYLTFEFRAGGIYDKQGQKLNIVEFSNDGLNGTEWGILIVTVNPRNADGTAIVIAGYSGYGTNAAAVTLSRLDQIVELQQREPFEALIRVTIKDGIVGNPEVVTVRTLPEVEQQRI